MSGFLQQILNFTGTFNIQLLVLLYFACIFGEVWFIAVPYLLETVWLLAGYNVSIGVLSPLNMLIMWLVAQAGRQTGVLLLTMLSRLGSVPIIKLYQKYVEKRVNNISGKEGRLPKFLGKLDSYISPFTVAFGRLFGLGTILTITLGVKKKYKTLMLGVILASIVFDGIFILTGLLVGTNKVVKHPIQMLVFSFLGLTSLYVIVFSVRQLFKWVKGRRIASTNQPDKPVNRDSS